MADAPTSHPATNGALPQPPTNGTGATVATAENSNAPTSSAGLSADEIALYDRQIRLWGAQAQERIRAARILLVSLRALGTEIAKNLTLAGVRSLTIVDDEPVTEEDLGAGFFFREEDVGKPRAEAAIPRIQELNPRVRVSFDGSLSLLLSQNETYFAPFDCIIACDYNVDTLGAINAAARVAARPFYAACVHGFYGYIFADLVAHEFVVEREKSNRATTIGPESLTRSVVGVTDRKESGGKTSEIVKKQEVYCPLILANSSPLPPDVMNNRRRMKAVPALLPCLRALFEFQHNHNRLPASNSKPDIEAFAATALTKCAELLLPTETLQGDFVRSFMHNIGAELGPTASFVGGRLSEDVINVLGKREQPIQNFALFDGDSLEGKIYSLYSPPPEMGLAMNPSAQMPNMLQLDASTGMMMGSDLGMGMNMDGSGMDMSAMGMMGMPMGNGFMAPGIGLDDGATTFGMGMPIIGQEGLGVNGNGALSNGEADASGGVGHNGGQPES